MFDTTDHSSLLVFNFKHLEAVSEVQQVYAYIRTFMFLFLLHSFRLLAVTIGAANTIKFLMAYGKV